MPTTAADTGPRPRPAREVDVLVVGGGINGAGIARDLAGRGARVLLCEKDDLAAHTSAASTKLIHGGLRYLEYREFSLVRKALAEREVLLKGAPHIMWPLRFVMPHDPSMRPVWMIRARPLPLRPSRASRGAAGIAHASTCARTPPARRSSPSSRAASSIPTAGSTTRGWWRSAPSTPPSAARRC